MQKFYKGRTNNHLSWVMVDATDFATPESAMSAATKIKIYGKLRGATGTNFVSSGTGSLTNDITHVGASVLGIYTIALAKADLSDASAAWYDQYIISLSATGAAYQTLVVDGGIDDSTMLLLSDAVSNAYSAAVVGASRILVVQSATSDILSACVALSDAASNAYSAAVVGTSRILLVQSRLSDLDSRLVSEFSDMYSQLSDFRSDIKSFMSTTGVGLNASTMSDLRSAVAAVTVNLTASDISDIASAVLAGAGATVLSASDMSDIASRVWAEAAGTALASRVLVMKSTLSDAYSMLSDLQSDFQSRVPKAVATNSQLSDLASDLKSHLTVSSGVQSDIYSLLSDFQSDFQSRVPKRVATDSQLSDLASDLKSHVAAGVNVTKLNGTTLNGNGAGTPWGP